MSLFTTYKEDKPKKSSLFDKCHSAILDYTTNLALQSTLTDYLVLRLAMKDKPIYGINQWKGLLNKLSSLSNDTNEMIKIVEQSIERGWGTFVDTKHTPFNTPISKFGEYSGMSCTQTTYNSDEKVRGYF